MHKNFVLFFWPTLYVGAKCRHHTRLSTLSAEFPIVSVEHIV